MMTPNIIFRSISCYFLFAIVMAGSVCCSQCRCQRSTRSVGTWDVLAELVTSTAENPNDPYAPKPGTIKPDVWTIQNSDGGPVLTGSSGSIQGQYTENGAVLRGQLSLGLGGLHSCAYRVLHGQHRLHDWDKRERLLGNKYRDGRDDQARD